MTKFEQIGCGYCKHEKICMTRVFRMTQSFDRLHGPVKCTDFKHWTTISEKADQNNNIFKNVKQSHNAALNRANVFKGIKL
jgi:hypothetical protein